MGIPIEWEGTLWPDEDEDEGTIAPLGDPEDERYWGDNYDEFVGLAY